MPNNIAYGALILWPFFSLFLYRNLRIVPATFWTIVGGYLILPVRVAFDFPMIPPLDQQSIPALSAFVGCLLIKKVKIRPIPGPGVERWLILVLLIAPFITVLNNQESVVMGGQVLRGLAPYDAISAVANQYLALLPFILGMQLVRTQSDQLTLFKLFLIAGLLYSVLILFELRMSPQLHTWLYGFFPHTFGQQVRFGGFRAVVFMGHGLLVAMFLVMVLGAALALWREKQTVMKLPPGMVVVYLLGVLFLQKSLTAIALGFGLVFAISFAGTRTLKVAALSLAFFAVFYPLLSMVELVPHHQIVEAAAVISQERADSLNYRFFNETQLLDRAQEKILFGWGGYGRNRLFDSVTDGYWIITLGIYGLVGFLALFGLLFNSVQRAVHSSNLVPDRKAKILLLSHALIVAVIMIDQIPNASMASWLWFVVGALAGRSVHILTGQSQAGAMPKPVRRFKLARGSWS